MLTNFGIILVFFIVGFLFVGLGLVAAAVVRPSHPNPIKNSTYECGELPFGGSWFRFNIRFYVIALIFLLFDVEIVFLLPWAVVFKQFGWFGYFEMLIFVVILLTGLAYVWAKGDLDWDRPVPVIPRLKDLVINKKVD